MIAAIVWMGVGAIVILFTMALCQAASRGDRMADEAMEKERRRERIAREAVQN
jgi:heme exporter protein D